MEQTYTISADITTTRTVLKLPVKLEFDVKKIKILSCSYTTADNNLSYYLLLNINNFDTQGRHLKPDLSGAVRNMPYLLKLPLNRQFASQNIYINRFERFDATAQTAIPLQHLDIGIFINGENSDSLITPINPVYIEFLLSS